MVTNKHVLSWIEEMAALTCPDKIVWIDGSEEQAEALRAEACSTGEMIKLNEEKLPGCYLHHTAVNDVARVEGRTFICTSKKEDAGTINNWMDPGECYEKLGKLYPSTDGIPAPVKATAGTKTAASGKMADAQEALLVLGYSRSEIAAAMKHVDMEASLEEIIKKALAALMK